MNFKGYLRPNGTVGIRNHVVAIPTVFCANGAVDNIAKRVPGVIGLSHSDGCDTKRVRTPYFNPSIMNLCRNPNIYAAIIVSLGCEPENASRMAAAKRLLRPAAKKLECFWMRPANLSEWKCLWKKP